MPARSWLELTTEDFRGRDMSRAIAVLPVAAVEQHGPHLPVGVDTYVNEGYLARMMELVPDELDVLVLPVQAVGKSNEHLAFRDHHAVGRDGDPDLDGDRRERPPGGLPQARVRELARRQRRDPRYRGPRAAGAARAPRGQRRLAPARLSGGALRRGRGAPRHPWRRRGDVAHARAPQRYGSDGPGAELRAPTVDMERRFEDLGATQPIGFGWMSQDLHEAGAMGDAAQATREKGEASLEHGARAFVALLREVDHSRSMPS